MRYFPGLECHLGWILAWNLGWHLELSLAMNPSLRHRFQGLPGCLMAKKIQGMDCPVECYSRCDLLVLMQASRSLG